jgi:hypothetical protein
MLPKKCCTKTNSSEIKVSDPRSTCAVFTNKERVDFNLVKFDGCVLTNKVACDWIVEKSAVGRVAVELKGCDVDHAAEQIAEALQYLRESGVAALPVAGLIVCSRYPRVDTKVQRMKQRLARDFRAPLTVKTDGRGLVFEKLLAFS